MQYTDLVFDLYGTLVDIHTEEDDRVWEKTAFYFGFYGAAYTGPELKAAFRKAMERREAKAGQSYECFPDIPFEEVMAIFTAYELRLLGLGDQLDGIYLSSNYQCRKPDLRFYQALIDERNLDVTRTLMIGNDRQTDIAGAKNAGMATLYMHTALTPADQEKADEKKAIGKTDGREYEFEGDDWSQLVELILSL